MDKDEFSQKNKEQELLIKELKAELNVKNQCLALLAHDFVGTSRNLLWVINALEDGSVSPEIFSSLLPELKASVELNQQAIDSTVAWVNSQQIGFKAQQTAISLFTLFSSIGDFYSVEIKRKGITFRFEGNKEAAIESDNALASFILKKVVDNAIKFSHEGNEVVFSIEEVDNKRIRIAIEDFGVGMSPQTLSNLFTLNGSPYTGTSNEKGTGLSLVIANHFAKLIDGTLTVKSVENYGTRIELDLPVCYTN